MKFDLTANGNKFKILNATNGGPWCSTRSKDSPRSNFLDYKAARIPYSRNHDSGAVAVYGGPFSHDISKIFPNFDADVNDPASYDFACTDDSILVTLEAGTETFFRLGQTIEHQVKKHDTLPPKDFKKWAEICEHIILHYNEGWADGFHLNIQYWEIWNEPDLDEDDSLNKRTWGGTKTQFFDLYEIAAKHLKGKFPHLKIGGPALAYRLPWADEFLAEMKARKVPIDFFSWHIYCTEPAHLLARAEKIKDLLIKHGYNDAETILNEWNYVESWSKLDEAIMTIHGIKGAAFTMACMSAVQKSPALDMLMYYDTIPSIWCGLFDYYTHGKLKGYYPLYWYGMFYDMEHDVPVDTGDENIYALCGVDKNGKIMCVLTHYSNDVQESKKVSLDFGRKAEFDVYLLDENHDGEYLDTTENPEFDMPIYSCILLREK